ncbi:MAG: aminodeoxychorismate synthase component I [Akkermansia sp.]|nr:aminodeoxychorismate synthase component I [Akkermansia sp.]
MQPSIPTGAPAVKRNSIAARLNALAGAGRPFAFAIPYAADSLLVSGEDAGFLYSLPNGSNTPQQHCPLPQHIAWDPEHVDRAAYHRAFSTVQRHLLRGDSYLANLCMATPVRTNLGLEHIYHHARAPYKMMLRGQFACFSPEPFVTIGANRISTFPMKGTLPGHLPLSRLMDDEKERREHATIVDLLRNDLALVGHDVRVDRYRYPERITNHCGTLWATSSQISATLEPGWQHRLGDLLLRMLPAGSITGAPKEWTCRAIAEAEPHPRGFYTGIFGCFDGATLRSAVSIRFVQQAEPGRLLYHSGGGITLLSDEESEYRELCDKIYVPFAL